MYHVSTIPIKRYRVETSSGSSSDDDDLPRLPEPDQPYDVYANYYTSSSSSDDDDVVSPNPNQYSVQMTDARNCHDKKTSSRCTSSDDFLRNDKQPRAKKRKLASKSKKTYIDSSDEDDVSTSPKPKKSRAKKSRSGSKKGSRTSGSGYYFQDPKDPLNAEIDTSTITTQQIVDKVKTLTKTLGISQAIFAKNLLGRTQGTLSDLLKKPKPWEELRSGKGIFLRMHHWSNLPTQQMLEVLDNDLVTKQTKPSAENKPRISRKSTSPSDIKPKEDMKVEEAPKKLNFDQKEYLWNIFRTSMDSVYKKRVARAVAENTGMEFAVIEKFCIQAQRQRRCLVNGEESDGDWNSDMDEIMQDFDIMYEHREVHDYWSKFEVKEDETETDSDSSDEEIYGRRYR